IPADSSVETCNRADDDCDGNVDEGDPGGGAACGMDTGECAIGTTRCDSARGRIVCDGEITPTTEICNGSDDDCDGSVDEGDPGGGGGGGTSRGVCEVGHEQWVDGALACVDQVTGGPEVCNKLDDDCDGRVDEESPGGGAASGNTTGECSAGVLTCDRGALV